MHLNESSHFINSLTRLTLLEIAPALYSCSYFLLILPPVFPTRSLIHSLLHTTTLPLTLTHSFTPLPFLCLSVCLSVCACVLFVSSVLLCAAHITPLHSFKHVKCVNSFNLSNSFKCAVLCCAVLCYAVLCLPSPSPLTSP